MILPQLLFRQCLDLGLEYYKQKQLYLRGAIGIFNGKLVWMDSDSFPYISDMSIVLYL